MAMKKAASRTGGGIQRAGEARAARKPAAKASERKRTPVSAVLATVHESVSAMHRLGFVDARTMRDFDRGCMVEVERLSPQDIADLRAREGVSQSMFAIHLNVTKSTVAQWEAGQKKPAGAALKLLNLVKRKGLKILA
jgi:putative transcriptional regulator